MLRLLTSFCSHAQGCVPRICHLRITKIEALTQLTSSKTEIKVVVVMNDGRSRLRDGVRAARLKRAALSSAPMPVHASSTCSIPVNINFYMQYFHNLRTNSDTFRILLQKKSKRSLRNKVIAECTVVLADVLQMPAEEGSHLVLSSTGRLKQKWQGSELNMPMVRLHVLLESLTLDSSDLTHWWPSDKTDDMECAPNIDGVFSDDMSEEDQEDNDENADDHDQDEWVETHEILSASMNQEGFDVELCAGIGSDLSSPQPYGEGSHAELHAGVDIGALQSDAGRLFAVSLSLCVRARVYV